MVSISIKYWSVFAGTFYRTQASYFWRVIESYVVCITCKYASVFSRWRIYVYYLGYSKFFSIIEAQLPLLKTGPELGDIGN